MYRKLKNILGVSLMALAIVISQLPMGDAQAETEATHTVTFSMNGGSFSGTYNGYQFQDDFPVLLVDNGKTIGSFPDDQYASYTGYKTEKGVWFTDRTCLEPFDRESAVTDSITLYKKWYNITSDGSTLADHGFYLNPDGSVLYRYDGEETLVEIPDTVTIIAEGAFDSLDEVRGIVLPPNIKTVEENAFSGLKNDKVNFIYLFDSDTTASQEMAKRLENEYERLKYSEYHSAEDMARITGIQFYSDSIESASETSTSTEENTKTEADTSTETGDKTETNTSTGTDTQTGTDTKTGTDTQTGTDTKTETSTSTETAAKTEEKTYTVVFHMNGGGFTGNYDGASYTNAASVKANVTVGKGMSAKYLESDTSDRFQYSNYSTDSNWYTDKECLSAYEGGSGTVLSGDLTLYKKWYYTSSGFTMNPSGNILYKYNGNVADIVIPNTVTVIAANAFSSMGSISTITLPDNISDVKENAFSGAKNLSKDITVTGNSESAKSMAKKLAEQYTHLVYQDSQTASLSSTEEDSAVSIVESGSIKLGATISGTVTAVQSTAGTTAASVSTASAGTTTSGSIALGADTSSLSASATQVGTATGQTGGTAETVSTSSSGSAQDSSASVVTGVQTTSKQAATSASAPRSTQHVKDSTPKTGDSMDYRTLIVCALFAAGVLLVLTGNGKGRRASAS